MSSNDFMPLEGWDHVELWVGNAKQAAFFYEHAFGFTPIAYAASGMIAEVNPTLLFLVAGGMILVCAAGTGASRTVRMLR